MADELTPEEEAAPAEPVVLEPWRVAHLAEVAAHASESYTDLRAEMGGLVCDDQVALDAFAHHVATRVLGYRRAGVADALLCMLLVERLVGVSEAPVVRVPEAVLAERVASQP